MKTAIQETINVLKNGGTVLYPTDTVWGIGCDATNTEAVKKIFSIKQRSREKNLVVLVANDGMLNKYVSEVPEIAWDLIDESIDPLTIVYSKAKNLPNEVIASDGSIGIRMVKNGFVHQLITNFNKPIISTSANISGQPTPTTFQQIDSLIHNQVDYVVDVKLADQSRSKPSSILKVENNGEIKILRN